MPSKPARERPDMTQAEHKREKTLRNVPAWAASGRKPVEALPGGHGGFVLCVPEPTGLSGQCGTM